MRATMKMRWIAAAAGLAVGLVALAIAARADPNALWNIVHNQCVPDEQQHGDPKPCAAVNLQNGIADGFVVLKDIRGATQYLLLPTAQISGIEDPAILAPGAPNYFAAAWQATDLVEKALGHPLPRDSLSLAINSQLARTQNQLHIHIDCVRADVRAALLSERSNIGWRWRPLPMLLAGHRYRAIRVNSRSLDGYDPFKLLASDIPGVRADMGRHTLVVVGMTFMRRVPGFIVLDDHADWAQGDNAGGEELQDHACAVGH